MSLIQRLNALATKTPDEIAIHLSSNNGWFQGKQFTRQMVADAQGKMYRIKSARGGELGSYSFDFSFERMVKGLDKHWFKPQTEYGGRHDKPDLPA